MDSLNSTNNSAVVTLAYQCKIVPPTLSILDSTPANVHDCHLNNTWNVTVSLTNNNLGCGPLPFIASVSQNPSGVQYCAVLAVVVSKSNYRSWTWEVCCRVYYRSFSLVLTLSLADYGNRGCRAVQRLRLAGHRLYCVSLRYPRTPDDFHVHHSLQSLLLQR